TTPFYVCFASDSGHLSASVAGGVSLATRSGLAVAGKIALVRERSPHRGAAVEETALDDAVKNVVRRGIAGDKVARRKEQLVLRLFGLRLWIIGLRLWTIVTGPLSMAIGLRLFRLIIGLGLIVTGREFPLLPFVVCAPRVEVIGKLLVVPALPD